MVLIRVWGNGSTHGPFTRQPRMLARRAVSKMKVAHGRGEDASVCSIGDLQHRREFRSIVFHETKLTTQLLNESLDQACAHAGRIRVSIKADPVVNDGEFGETLGPGSKTDTDGPRLSAGEGVFHAVRDQLIDEQGEGRGSVGRDRHVLDIKRNSHGLPMNVHERAHEGRDELDRGYSTKLIEAIHLFMHGRHRGDTLIEPSHHVGLEPLEAK